VALIQNIFRKLSTRFYKPILANYLKKTRIFQHHPFTLTIFPGVFHPQFFYSTKFLLQYLNQINFKQKKVIEVGAGNGLIAFNIAISANKVIALELSKIAIKGLLYNQQNNQNVLPPNVLQIIESNLFQALNPQVFDYIIVNPPYYPNKVNNEIELAWNCGEEFEYFTDFFTQARNFMNQNSMIIMVLSSQSNLNKISQIALNIGFNMHLKSIKKFLIEDNFIFECKLINA